MSMFICVTIFRSYRHLKIVANHLAEEVQFYPYIEQLEKWCKFVNKHNIYKTDLSVLVQDIDGNEYPDVEFSLDNLLALNKHLLEAHKKEKVIQSEQKKSHNITPADASTSYVSQGDQTLTLCSQADTQVDINSSSSSTSSFVILHTSKDIENTKETDLSKPDTETYSQSESDPDNSDSEFHPASLQNKSSPIVLPQTNTQPNHTSHETSPDIDMGDRVRDRLAFFPPEKFDGRNKNHTKQYWQVFKDFCDKQKLYFEPLIVDGADPIAAAPFAEITKYFKNDTY